MISQAYVERTKGDVLLKTLTYSFRLQVSGLYSLPSFKMIIGCDLQLCGQTHCVSVFMVPSENNALFEG